jgi:hypothetical protein
MAILIWTMVGIALWWLAACFQVVAPLRLVVRSGSC